MITLSHEEIKIASKITQLKEAAGSHSPSISTIAQSLPELEIKVDACFLSNPYATDLFLEYLDRELISTGKLRDVLEFYPSQNEVIAELISGCINVNKENIFVGNGAIEVIQAVLHNFATNKIVVNIPTFSSYYEFARPDVDVIFYQLDKANNYLLQPDHYIDFVKKSGADTVVIINPNNPNGGYLKYSELRYILNNLRAVPNIIIDESFIHFAFESAELDLMSATELSKEFSNVIVIKSMSKDFGIAGMRSGYGVMDKRKVNRLLTNGYLWNSSGLSEYFFRLYSSEDFLAAYEVVRKKYIKHAQVFFDDLRSIPQLKVYPSMANFALVELLDSSTASDFVSKLLIKHGVYTRTGSDKIGLDGEFVRIASRTREENQVIISAIRELYEG